MQRLKLNIIKVYGKLGERWLAELPRKIEQLQRIWGLSGLKPFPNLSYSYVLAGFQDNLPVVLKISPDINKEAKALCAFQGFGVVSVLGCEQGALLLQKAVPGDLLKNSIPKQKRVEIACNVMAKLHKTPVPTNEDFPAIEEWLSALDKEWALPKDHLKRARKLKNELLKKDTEPKVFLHGDLHQENILSNGKDWIVIDPKGVIGRPIHEIWACIEDPSHDLQFVADFLGYPFPDVVGWYYVHLILSSCWQVEDGLNPIGFLSLAQSVLPMIYT